MRQSKYSQEFKNSTVELIINNNESVVKVAEDLDLNPKPLYHWLTMYKKAHKIHRADKKEMRLCAHS